MVICHTTTGTGEPLKHWYEDVCITRMFDHVNHGQNGVLE
jgi:hypothetical protein